MRVRERSTWPHEAGEVLFVGDQVPHATCALEASVGVGVQMGWAPLPYFSERSAWHDHGPDSRGGRASTTGGAAAAAVAAQAGASPTPRGCEARPEDEALVRYGPFGRAADGLCLNRSHFGAAFLGDDAEPTAAWSTGSSSRRRRRGSN